MLTCSTCLRRALHNLAYDFSSSTHSLVGYGIVQHCAASRPTTSIHVRKHTSLSTLRKGHHRQEYIKTFGRKKGQNATSRGATALGNKRRQAPWATTKVERRDALAREKNRAMMLRHGERRVGKGFDEKEQHTAEENEEKSGIVPPSQAADTVSDSHSVIPHASAQRKASLRKATQDVRLYYKDPLQLANGVIQRLRVPDIEGALDLVRASENVGIDNIVSWNHCVDWLMAQGDTKQALRVYNEMKKRGRRPDAHTYTIMLRGFSRSVDGRRGGRTAAVQEAVKVYNSIFAPNSNVQPNTIHTNAIINVCARGGDMDALWAVAGRLPEFGPGCPDRWTFTTILNAIRDNVIREASRLVDRIKTKEDREEAEKSRALLFEQAVADGRRVWEDVNWRWRRADLVMDEQLVCAMGRLLLGCGKPKEVEQVFDLVDQTMNLRISGRRQTADWLQLTAPKKSGERDAEIGEKDQLDVVPQFQEADQKTQTKSKSQLPFKQSVVYAKPGNNTLSMILEAAALHSIPNQSLARSYWNALTDSSGLYKVAPDAQNIIAYMRVLRRNRASQETYALLSRDWPDDVAQRLYRRATFIIAFSTCVRDKNNPNVFDTARKLLRLMEDKLEESALGLFDRNAAIADLKTGKERRKARKSVEQEMEQELAEQSQEFDDYELQRRKEGVQSLKVDPKALTYFVDLGIVTTKGWNEGVRGKDDGEVFERDPEKNNAMIALRLVAPHVLGLRKMVQLKMEELQLEESLPRSSKARHNMFAGRGSGGRLSMDWDPRSGSRVGEEFDELILLMRNLVSAYDKVLTIAERFEMQGKEQISKKVRKDFDDRRRQFTGYMARIEKDVKRRMQDSTAFHNQEEDGKSEVEEELPDETPQIETQLQRLYQGVDEQISSSRRDFKDERTRRKGFKHARLGNDSSRGAVPKMHSRRQAKERENLIATRMRQQFPNMDYGVLDEDLTVREGRREKLRMEGKEWKKRMNFEGKGNDDQAETAQYSITGDERVQDIWGVEWRKQQQEQQNQQQMTGTRVESGGAVNLFANP